MKTPLLALALLAASTAAAQDHLYEGTITLTVEGEIVPASAFPDVTIGSIYAGVYEYASPTADGSFGWADGDASVSIAMPFQSAADGSAFAAGACFDGGWLDVSGGRVTFEATSDFGVLGYGTFEYDGPGNGGAWGLNQPDVGFGQYEIWGSLSATDPVDPAGPPLPDATPTATLLAIATVAIAASGRRALR
jgi:hypothetical protein